MKLIIKFIILLEFSTLSCAASNQNYPSTYTEENFKSDWSSPFYNNNSQAILLWGGLLTSGLIVSRNTTVLPFQRYMTKYEPLKDITSSIELMGRMIPNIAYIGYQFFQKNDKAPNAKKRSTYMFKVSLFSGMTTFFLKRIVNEQRPNQGDRNSFPSGHTTTAFAFSAVIAIEHPNWAIPAYTMATLVGLSRVNDNVHYIHDVTMGATIGIAYAYALQSTMGSMMENSLIIPLKKDGILISQYYLF